MQALQPSQTSSPNSFFSSHASALQLFPVSDLPFDAYTLIFSHLNTSQLQLVAKTWMKFFRNDTVIKNIFISRFPNLSLIDHPNFLSSFFYKQALRRAHNVDALEFKSQISIYGNKQAPFNITDFLPVGERLFFSNLQGKLFSFDFSTIQNTSSAGFNDIFLLTENAGKLVAKRNNFGFFAFQSTLTKVILNTGETLSSVSLKNESILGCLPYSEEKTIFVTRSGNFFLWENEGKPILLSCLGRPIKEFFYHPRFIIFRTAYPHPQGKHFIHVFSYDETDSQLNEICQKKIHPDASVVLTNSNHLITFKKKIVKGSTLNSIKGFTLNSKGLLSANSNWKINEPGIVLPINDQHGSFNFYYRLKNVKENVDVIKCRNVRDGKEFLTVPLPSTSPCKKNCCVTVTPAPLAHWTRFVVSEHSLLVYTKEGDVTLWSIPSGLKKVISLSENIPQNLNLLNVQWTGRHAFAIFSENSPNSLPSLIIKTYASVF